MPNMDGTGPRFGGQFMGRGNGRRGGFGRRNSGCRCGMGPCMQYAGDQKSLLEAQKDALKRSLSNVEKQLEML